MRAIHKLASLNMEQYPAAAEALQRDTFVDDVITGADDVPSAKILQQQLVEVLAQFLSNIARIYDPCGYLAYLFR